MPKILTWFGGNIAFLAKLIVDLQLNDKVIKKGSRLVIMIPGDLFIPKYEKKKRNHVKRSDLVIDSSDGAGVKTDLDTWKIKDIITEFYKEEQSIKATFINSADEFLKPSRIPLNSINNIEIIDIYKPEEASGQR